MSWQVSWLPGSWYRVALGKTSEIPIVSGLDVVADDIDSGQLRYVRTTDICGLSTLKSGSALGVDKAVAGDAIVEQGDLLMTRSGSLGTSYIHAESESMSYAGYLVRYRPNTRLMHPRFVAWWTQSRDHLDQISVGAVRSTIDNFSAKKFSMMSVPVPPLSVQYSIAAFLDRETAKIDAAIDKQRALVDGLRGRRRAMIEHAMSSGDWPSVELKWVSRIYSGGTPDREVPTYWTDGTIPWLNSGCVNQWAVTEPSEFITADGLRKSSAKWVPAGSVLLGLAGQGKTKGTAARLEIESTCNQSVAAIVPSNRLNYRFLHFWLSVNHANLRNLAGGDKRDGLNLQHVGSFKTPLPSLDEQWKLAAHMDRETSKINAMIARSERLIELSQERRSALITAAVTGQIDITVDTKALEGAA